MWNWFVKRYWNEDWSTVACQVTELRRTLGHHHHVGWRVVYNCFSLSLLLFSCLFLSLTFNMCFWGAKLDAIRRGIYRKFGRSVGRGEELG